MERDLTKPQKQELWETAMARVPAAMGLPRCSDKHPWHRIRDRNLPQHNHSHDFPPSPYVLSAGSLVQRAILFWVLAYFPYRQTGPSNREPLPMPEAGLY